MGGNRALTVLMEISMRTSNLPISGLSYQFILGELQELLEAVVSLNWTDIVDEACDVYTGTLCCIFNNTGIDLPIWWKRSGNRWVHRVEVITQQLGALGYEFKEKYLVSGSNIDRAEKWAKIIALAKEDQGEEVWLHRPKRAVALIRQYCPEQATWPGCVDCCSDGCYLDSLRVEEEKFFTLG